ncbi:MAG: sulfatase-like hydrolase/transferase [Opitutaceae bacterium]|nr:sulfatase-like hydrolase/transferase [Opitutaceae bacterium]
MIVRLLLCVMSLAWWGLAAKATPERRHIIFIQADDLGWRDLACYGGKHLHTPAIDSLARGGLRFTQAYGGGPVCTPSRAAMLTGLHAARLHITGQASYRLQDESGRRFLDPDFKTAIPQGTPCVARTLASIGYRTVLLGKWGFDDDPLQHGFSDVVTGGDQLLTERAIEAILNSSEIPLFLYLNFSRPHIPLKPDPKLLAKYEGAPGFEAGSQNPKYAAIIEGLDRDVGLILAAIEQKRIEQRTIVIFASDNGGYLGTEADPVTSNAPLREGKASLYEGGLRVPVVVRVPGLTAAGITDDSPIHSVDWHATLADLAGASVPGGLDGVSFAGNIRGEYARKARTLYWHFPHYRRSRPGIGASPSSAMREGDWKLIHFYEDNHVELFNLREDPGETRNLALQFPSRSRDLLFRLNAWRVSVAAQPPVPNVNYGRPASDRQTR